MDGAEVADALGLEERVRHALDAVERGPVHLVTEHLQICQLEDGLGLEVHVVLVDLVPAFLDAGGDVRRLGLLVRPDPLDKVRQRLLEHCASRLSADN